MPKHKHTCSTIAPQWGWVQVVKMMEGSVADVAEVEFSGKLKELLPRLSRKARNDLLAEFMQTEPLKDAQPVRAPACLVASASQLWASFAPGHILRSMYFTLSEILVRLPLSARAARCTRAQALCAGADAGGNSAGAEGHDGATEERW